MALAEQQVINSIFRIRTKVNNKKTKGTVAESWKPCTAKEWRIGEFKSVVVDCKTFCASGKQINYINAAIKMNGRCFQF